MCNAVSCVWEGFFNVSYYDVYILLQGQIQEIVCL
jgi:hypothetical protein